MRWTLALWAVSLFVGSAAAQFSGLPAGISSRLLFSPLREPTDACAFAPLGATGQTHAFIVTQPGKLLLYNGTRMVQFADLGKSRNLVYEGESGLLACVADSSAIWLFYSVPSAHVVSRIPFTLNPARLLLAQEKRLVVMPRVATQHTGGALAWFREAGRRYLLIARGDDARCDYSSGPECAAILSKSDYRGKILRGGCVRSGDAAELGD